MASSICLVLESFAFLEPTLVVLLVEGDDIDASLFFLDGFRMASIED
jgi:hypothetical protein